MDALSTLLSALHACPEDDTGWLALADCLEENGLPERAELTHLTLQLRRQDGPDRPEQEERLRALLAAGVAPCVPELVNSLGMRFALVPPGTFWMGSPDGDAVHHDEKPRHRVRITRAFYLGVFPVTQEQYQRLTGANPSAFASTGANRGRVSGLDTHDFPVEMVSWQDAMDCCHSLTLLSDEARAGWRYTLPSEAEWEYACRAGTTTPFSFGDDLGPRQANFDAEHPFGNAAPGVNLDRPTPVGSFPPNAFGLFDTHGNVWEWCHDWYDDEYYAFSPEADPPGQDGGTLRVMRGGAWYEYATDCRSAFRLNRSPTDRRDCYGFRVCLRVGA